jgi:hypothetical protein
VKSTLKYLVATFFQLLGLDALAHPPQHDSGANNGALNDQPFITEYAWGVQRLPMDGGKIYGWKLNDGITFGRFKGENDEFGFSVELDPRQRVEITTEGFRWRKAIGGAR